MNFVLSVWFFQSSNLCRSGMKNEWKSQKLWMSVRQPIRTLTESPCSLVESQFDLTHSICQSSLFCSLCHAVCKDQTHCLMEGQCHTCCKFCYRLRLDSNFPFSYFVSSLFLSTFVLFFNYKLGNGQRAIYRNSDRQNFRKNFWLILPLPAQKII